MESACDFFQRENRDRKDTLYSRCINITSCFFEIGNPIGILALSSCDRKNPCSSENSSANSRAYFTDAIAKCASTCGFR